MPDPKSCAGSTTKLSKVLTSAQTPQLPTSGVESGLKMFRNESEAPNIKQVSLNVFYESQTSIFKINAKFLSQLNQKLQILTVFLQQIKSKKISNFLEVEFSDNEPDRSQHHRLAGVLENSSAKKKLRATTNLGTKNLLKLKATLMMTSETQ